MKTQIPVTLVILIMVRMSATFLLPEITMDMTTFEACQTCDSRADGTLARTLTEALKDYMYKQKIILAIERGDVVVEETLANSAIDTGHSCSITAEARNVKLEAKMVNDKDVLKLDQVFTVTEVFGTAVAWDNLVAGLVPHTVDVAMDVRFRFGSKWFGKCYKYGRKTCEARATSKGTNNIVVSLIASEVQGYTQNGQEFVDFKLGVQVYSSPNNESYSPMALSTIGSCRLPFNIAKLTGRVGKYGSEYLTSKKTEITQARSAGLIAKLNEVLQTDLANGGSVITIPVNVVGGSGGRRKRAAGGKCQRMKCPEGFNRIGNTEKCMKMFGFRKTDCSQYGVGAEVKIRKISRWTLYMCEVPMVPE